MSEPTANPEEQAKTAAKPSKTKKTMIVAVHGELRHLFTNVVFSADPKPVDMDNFIEVQIAAGKLAVYED